MTSEWKGDEKMGLGSSAGRSRRNRTGEGARRRGTPRERAHIDPPWDALEPAFHRDEGSQLTRRGEWMLTSVTAVSVLAFCVLLGIVLFGWGCP